MLLADEILDEAQRLIRRHERYAQDLTDEFRRRNRRTGAADVPNILRPSYWDVDPGFNPYLVRARNERIGRSIRARLRGREYEPRNAVCFEVPKPDGTMREVSVFQVADSAVSRVVFNSLLRKNRQRLSAYSFAYRSDVTVHDAIQHIAADIRDKPRIFVAEYDFTRYFDSILHEHVWQHCGSKGFCGPRWKREYCRDFLRPRR